MPLLENVQNPRRFDVTPSEALPRLQEALDACIRRIEPNLDVFVDTFPAPASVQNVYPAHPNTDWTSGFWTGLVWLGWEVTGDPRYKALGSHHVESFLHRIADQIHVDHHDMGFLYTLSCVAAWKLTGNVRAREAAILAAEKLSTRYFEKAGIIQAWGSLSDPSQLGRMIIDCLLNLPLLHWASEETGLDRYTQMATTHATQSAKYIIRENGSSFHTFYMDVETGAPKYGKTHQGHADDSCWARGQAWGICGLALNYRYVQEPAWLEGSRVLARYFLNRLPEDLVCYWDLDFTEGTEPRDSSAAAIAACGLLELSGHLPVSDPDKRLFENAAVRIVLSLADHYLADPATSNGILLHAVYGKPQKSGVDECNIWGDYYFMEALMRLTRDWKPYW